MHFSHARRAACPEDLTALQGVVFGSDHTPFLYNGCCPLENHSFDVYSGRSFEVILLRSRVVDEGKGKLDRRGPPREPERRVASRQEPQASTQDGPWKGGSDRPPAHTSIAPGAESQGALEDEHNAGAGWLVSVGSDLRSTLGIAALLVFVLPAIVLVLTLLGDDNKPVAMKTATARGRESAINHQNQPQGGERNAGRDGSPGTSSEDDGVGPTQQTGRDHKHAHQAEDATVAAVPATPTAAAAASPEPASSAAASSVPATESVASSVQASASPTSSVPPDTSTTPSTATQPTSAPAESAPPPAQQSSSPDASAPAIAAPDASAPAIAGTIPGDVPEDAVQEGLPDASVYDPSNYAGGAPYRPPSRRSPPAVMRVTVRT